VKRRALLVLTTILSLLVAVGTGRPGAAYGDTMPDCISTFGRDPFALEWRNEARRIPGTDAYTLAEGAYTPIRLTVGDDGEGDHWNVIVVEQLTGKEIWRQDGLGARQAAVIPESVWTVGGLYSIQTQRWLKDGRQSSSSYLVEIVDRATAQRFSESTLDLSTILVYPLSQQGAVSARVTLRQVDTGVVLLTTQINPRPGLTSGDQPMVQLRLLDYLDAAADGKKVSVTLEELDSAGRILPTQVLPATSTLRAPMKPAWKQEGGVISPTVMVEWESVPGAHWYQISVSSEGEGPALAAVLPGDATNYQFTTPLAPGPHWVSIAAELGGCRQDWSDSLPVVVDDLPWRGILSPAPETLTEYDLSVRLRRADWINSYQVELFEEGTGRLLGTRKWPGVQDGDSVYFSTKPLIPGHAYRIQATASLTTIRTPLVDSVTFTYNPPIRLGFKQALQGARVAKENLPLSWDSVPGATSYALLLTRVSSFANLQTRYSVGAATDFALRGQALESGRTYRLALEATLADGTKLTSDPVTFTVQ
jgi:hypothetical protein